VKRRRSNARDSEWSRKIHWKKHQEEEALKRQEEAKRKHAEALEATAGHRKDDLAKAAEWWRLHQSAADFISACERRWLNAKRGELTAEQKGWLEWAREASKGLSPFEAGYPEPAIDGAFDPAAVPFGGPYPATRKFPQPPTMPTFLPPSWFSRAMEHKLPIRRRSLSLFG
jgi:hypothetical protein